MRSSRSHAAVLAASLALWSLPAVASAQTGLSGTECLPLRVDGCTADGVGTICASAPPSTCVGFVTGAHLCVPDDFAVFCCTGGDGGCPLNEGTALSCVPSIGPLGQGLCLDRSDDYCNGGGVPTHSDFSMCQTVGGVAVAWADGDCDGDGVANGVDDYPCPLPQATWGADGCLPLSTTCMAGTTCTTNGDAPGFCEVDPSSGQTICVPDGPLVYCGGDAFACPDGTVSVFDAARSQAFCVPGICAEPSLSCIQAGGEFVPFEDGDCDGDGIANGAEAETDVCVPEGTTVPDGGNSVGDGGTGSADGGPGDINPRFGGGGGCACNTDPRSTPTPWALCLALALGFALRRRA